MELKGIQKVILHTITIKRYVWVDAPIGYISFTEEWA
ncbi:MAG: class I tRNA ligase family protein, partial [Methanosarcinales archaeon]